MKFFRRVFAPALAFTLGIAGAALSCTPVQAAAPPDCKTVVTHLVDRPDNGHGTPGTWALDTMTRTLVVCRVVEAAPAAKVAIDTWTYNAVLKDSGTFVTRVGAHGSPNNGVALAGGVHGVVSGKADFAKFTAPHDWIAWDASAVDGKTFTGSAPVPTGDWVKQLWKDGFGGTSITSYGWVYQTCVGKIVTKGYVEQWIDSSAESNNDGQSASAGDITGKACPVASASPSAPASAPTSPRPTSPTAVSLPVTGSNTPAIAAGGAGLLGLGVVLVVLAMRRRRTRVEFTA